MTVPNRSASSTAYRYGFNGMEKDDEIKGIGNSYDYGKRFYDPRVGRFLTLDPLASDFPYESNYNFVSNNPLIYNDPTGGAKILRIVITDRETGAKLTVAIVVDSWEIARGATKRLVYNEGKYFEAGHTEYTSEWHDINITQNIIREPDGSFTLDGESTVSLGEQVLATQPWKWAAKAEIVLRDIDKGLPGEGEAVMLQWLIGDGEEWTKGGGIMFYSKKGEGSGVRGKNAKLIDYVDGDALISFLKAGRGIARSGSDKTSADNNPSSTRPGKWEGEDEVSDELNALYDRTKEIFKDLDKIKKAAKKTKEIHDESGKFKADVWKMWGKTEDILLPLPDDGKLNGGSGGNQGVDDFEKTPRGPVNGGS